ncbi:MAG: hypothetical protein IPH12_13105 [Saprospirales bacterium]|nr:hypothetical protein [Saprospirales bacterium]MBK8921289.1 hypothetical protein [Saprospirales bacterium]
MTRTPIVALFLAITLATVLLPACRHEPLLPPAVDPDPIDTSANAGWPCSPDTAYFTNQVLPILISQCAKSGCHDEQSHEDGVVLTDYQRVMTTGGVKPFKANDSKLYESITKTDPDDRMPEPPNAPLTAEQKALIKQWIDQGARNNGCNENYGSCDTSGVTYSGFVSTLMTNRCTGCHGNINPQGGIKLTTYAEVTAVAQSGKLYGSIARLTGFSPMPNGGAAVSPCFTNKVNAWINAGMPQ